MEIMMQSTTDEFKKFYFFFHSVHATVCVSQSLSLFDL